MTWLCSQVVYTSYKQCLVYILTNRARDICLMVFNHDLGIKKPYIALLFHESHSY